MKEKSHSRGLSTSYLEPDRYEDEDDGAISLSAIKNKYKKGGAALKGKYYLFSVLQHFVKNCIFSISI